MSAVTAEGALASAKGDGDENFPVARLFAPRFRTPVKAFYRFARTGDDIADHPTAAASEKLARLEAMRATLAGESDADPPALALRRLCEARDLPARHGLDLLEAFTRDVTGTRYASWDALIDYCRVSAMPVGRFVLDVHGESRDLWPANDALCAALQVINHVQDCGRDRAALGRVYLPLDLIAAHGATLADLDRPRATPALRRVIVALAARTDRLLAEARPFSRAIRDTRLGVEVAVIQRLALSLNRRLHRRDPLSERVHHRKAEALGLAALAAFGRLTGA